MKRMVLSMLLVLAGTIPTLGAQPASIQDYVPADAVVFAYFQGLHNASQTFAGTAAMDIWKEQEMQQFRAEVARVLDGVLKQYAPVPIAFKDIRFGLDCEMLMVMLGSEGEQAPVVFVVRPQPRDRVVELQALAEHAKLANLTALWAGDDLVLGFDPELMDKVVRTGEGKNPSLVKSPAYQGIRKKTEGGGEFLVAHWNVTEFAKLLEDNEDFVKAWKVTGMTGVDSIHATMVPDKPGLRSYLYIHTPGGPQGLFKSLPIKPLDETTVLANVPVGASSFTAGRLDLNAVLEAIRQTVAAADGEGMAGFDSAMENFRQTFGFDPQKELPALGDQTVLQSVGPGFLYFPELAAFISVPDEAKAKESLTRMVEGMKAKQTERVAKLPQANRPPDWRQVFQNGLYMIDTTEYKGRQIVTVKINGIPLPLAPSFALSKKTLIVAAIPQTVQKAIELQDVTTRSILENEEFKTVRAHVSRSATMLVYSDPRQGFDGFYTMLPHVLQMTNGAWQLGPQSLGTKLPNSNVLTKHLFPCAGAMSYDGEGFMLEGYGPAGGLLLGMGANSNMTVGLVGIQAGFLLPALSQAQQAARATASLNNVRQIGLAMFQYAGDHDDAFPDSFAVLLKEGYLNSSKVFLAPNSGTRLPADFPAGDFPNADLEKLKAIDAVSDYEMVKGITHADDAEFIVVYEKRSFYRGMRTCFFNDGHVQSMPERQFQRTMADQTAKMRDRNN